MTRVVTVSKAWHRCAGGRGLAHGLRRRARVLPALLGLAIAHFALPAVAPGAASEAVKAEVKVTTANGYARLVITAEDEVESKVHVAGGVIVITFKRPLDVSVDHIPTDAAGYVGAARRDPDGRGIRLALARKVTVNSMAAAERLFVDLLPDNWTGVLPGLPQDVIEELARRAREAEKLLRQQRQASRERGPPQIRVRVATQPTFTRYVFELPSLLAVSSDRGKDGLTLVFAAPLKFDLADAQASLPPTVQSIDTAIGQDATYVKFVLAGTVDVRTFREDNSYVVDLSSADAVEPRASNGRNDDLAALIFDPASLKRAALGVEPPETVPARTQRSGNGAVGSKPAAPARAANGDAGAKPPASARSANSNTEAENGSAVPPPASLPVAAKPPPQVNHATAVKPVSPGRDEPTVKPAETARSKAQAEAERPAAAPAAAAPATAQPAPAPASVKPESAAVPRPPAPAAEAPPATSGDAPSAPPPAASTAADPKVLAVHVRRQGDNLRLVFPFAAPTPAAAFTRADMLWLVFDSTAKLDLGALNADASGQISRASVMDSRKDLVVRIRLARPRLIGLAAEGTSWVVNIGDAVLEPTRPLGLARNIVGLARASVTIPFDDPRELHRIPDPDIGDTLLVVTALGPARGFLKTQDFVEFRALAATHGVVVQPLADDVSAELAADKIVVSRPGGLTLSSTGHGGGQSATSLPAVFDPQLWGFDREANFRDRQIELLHAAASAQPSKRIAPRLDLARFYLARNMCVEAKAVLDVTLADDRATAEEPTALLLRAVANIMLGRADQALKDLSNPAIGNQYDAPLWRALAHARLGRWAEARAGFQTVEKTLATLPVELQRVALLDAARAAIEVGDYSGAAEELNEMETVGSTPEVQATMSVLSGRLAQGLGRSGDALAAYRAAAESPHRPAAAQGRLREILLRYELGDLKPAEVITDLETLTTLWRGDETEIEGLQLLARLYTQQERFRDAFYVMRNALRAHPNSEMTRRIHDEAARTFDSLFLAGKGDALPAIEALSLFYDFRELTPIGRRGDEMIRRMADRLVSVDLLDQAAELLQHQVDHRLQGAARAQVATRLAVIYLMNNKPDRAQATLKATRVSGLGTSLRNLRLMLEARALSDIGRHDVALEVIANIDRREAVRLRSDILWAAKRYAPAAEQIELYHGERWKEFEPLGDAERADILRAAIGYALGEDTIGLDRLKEKYAAKMADSADRRAFEIATAPASANAAEFNALAKAIASTNTLSTFLRELRAGYPEVGALSPVAAATAAPENRPAPPVNGRPEAASPTPAKDRTASRQAPAGEK